MVERVRIGLIGTSWWTDLMYVPSLASHPAVTVAAVCGRNAERAGEVAQKLGGAKVTADYRRMIAEGGLDAVIVAAPDDLHYEMTLAAIDAGLHVLCEKPLAGSASQACEMWEKAKAARVKHMVLFTWRWQPHWRTLKELVEQGHIGRCYHASFEFVGGFALDDGYKWRFDGNRANGITGDLGSHMIDFARWYLGDVREVMAELPVFVDQPATASPPTKPVNDVGLLTLKHAGGARSQICVSAVSRRADETVRMSVQLHGEQGTLEVRHTYFGKDAGVVFRGVRANEETFSTIAIPPHVLDGGVDLTALFDPYCKQSAGPRLFVDAILGDFAPEPGFDVGMRVQEVVDAALRSSDEQRWVSVPNGEPRKD